MAADVIAERWRNLEVFDFMRADIYAVIKAAAIPITDTKTAMIIEFIRYSFALRFSVLMTLLKVKLILFG